MSEQKKANGEAKITDPNKLMVSIKVLRTLSDQLKKEAESLRDAAVAVIKKLGKENPYPEKPATMFSFKTKDAEATLVDGGSDKVSLKFLKDNISKEELWTLFQEEKLDIKVEVIAGMALAKQWDGRSWKRHDPQERLNIELLQKLPKIDASKFVENAMRFLGGGK